MTVSVNSATLYADFCCGSVLTAKRQLFRSHGKLDWLTFADRAMIGDRIRNGKLDIGLTGRWRRDHNFVAIGRRLTPWLGEELSLFLLANGSMDS